jgi:hypothetical protein
MIIGHRFYSIRVSPRILSPYQEKGKDTIVKRLDLLCEQNRDAKNLTGVILKQKIILFSCRD